MSEPSVPADLWIDLLTRRIADAEKRAAFWEAAYLTAQQPPTEESPK